jgi:hypothetical protein
LRLRLLEPDTEARLWRLELVGCHLLHLELAAPACSGLAWTASLRRLSCLSLAGCEGLAAGALGALAGLPALRVLSLRGLAQVGDDAGPAMAALTQVRSGGFGPCVAPRRRDALTSVRNGTPV